MLQAMPQCKVQQRQRFSGSGGCRQRIQSLRRIARVPALFKNLIPVSIQGFVRGGGLPDVSAIGIQLFQKYQRVKAAVFRMCKVRVIIIHGRSGVVRVHQTGKQQSGIQHGFQFGGRRCRKLWQSEIGKVFSKRLVRLFQLRCVFNRGGFSGVPMGLPAFVCDRVQLCLYHIVGDETVVMPIDCFYYRAAAELSPVAAFQKAGAAYSMVNACPRTV